MAFGGFAHEEHPEVPAVLGVAAGTGAMFCSDSCLEDWCGEQPERRASLERVRVAPPQECCAFCWCCGSRLNDPECCVMHDGPCPVESFAATSWAAEVCQMLLSGLPLHGLVPDALFDIAEDLWGEPGMNSVEQLAAASVRTWMEHEDRSDSWPDAS